MSPLEALSWVGVILFGGVCLIILYAMFEGVRARVRNQNLPATGERPLREMCESCSKATQFNHRCLDPELCACIANHG